ncbi:MAG: hypothetical protein ACI8Z9_001498 [Paraglaciecola sp.]|jgi:hypothetical protein
MNISDLKAFLAEKPKHLGPDHSVQNQLRDAGLRQAVGTQGNHVSMQSSQFSSQTSVGLRVFNNALNSNLVLDQKNPRLPVTKQEELDEPKESLFDFEEIAKNVLSFVGGAIKHAQGKGADAATLQNLFEQASSGVLKGISMAEKDLAGMMNENIEKGIDRSQALIQQGIQQLKDKVFGTAQAEQNPVSNPATDIQNTRYQRSESGELNIRTRDGDQVSIRFEDLEQFQLNRQVIIDAQETKTTEPKSVNPPYASETSDKGRGQLEHSVRTKPVIENAASSSAEQVQGKTSPPDSNITVEEQYLHYERSAFSFSVKGELDENELKAIGNLVSDAADLADEFFHGDIDTAFNQALELGFDEQELTGFALQLTRIEQVQVIETYESVLHFKDDGQASDPAKAAKPVAHYLDKMLDVVEESREKLQDVDAYENMINDLINQMGEVHTPDLISAINRFHLFNKKLLDNLPAGFQREV